MVFRDKASPWCAVKKVPASEMIERTVSHTSPLHAAQARNVSSKVIIRWPARRTAGAHLSRPFTVLLEDSLYRVR